MVTYLDILSSIKRILVTLSREVSVLNWRLDSIWYVMFDFG